MSDWHKRLEAWIQEGFDNGFCSDIYCDMHDTIERTAEEWDRFNIGDDPCIYAVRIWENPPPPR